MTWNNYLFSNHEIFAAGAAQTDYIPRLVVNDHVVGGQCADDRTWLITGK
jgi:hypothetical protein